MSRRGQPIIQFCLNDLVRDGRVVKADAETLVVGDVVELEEGDRIPADCRVLYAEDFRCDESMLTGESKPVRKTDCVVTRPALAARANTAHLGTFCVRGSARCLVTACGMDTEMGKIAALLHQSKPAPAPLDKTVAKLGKVITAVVLFVALALFIGSLVTGRHTFLESLMSAVAVAVAAIPEGMGAVVTVILALGVQRMASSRAVMRRMGAVESLGGCSVICSDKTGTLTRNRMTVEAISTGDRMERETYVGTPMQTELLRCMRICHSVKGRAGAYVGDPTEIALLEYADGLGYFYDCERLGGSPFTSERKMMSVFCRTERGGRLYVKGGADVVLKKCSRILTAAGERTLTAQDRAKIAARAASFSAQAMRVLGFAFGRSEREEDLTFLGLAAMLDPPKEGVKEAVAACRRAGVRTVMITGDSPETAYAIALRLGIAKGRGEVITGDELDGMDEKTLARRAVVERGKRVCAVRLVVLTGRRGGAGEQDDERLHRRIGKGERDLRIGHVVDLDDLRDDARDPVSVLSVLAVCAVDAVLSVPAVGAVLPGFALFALGSDVRHDAVDDPIAALVDRDGGRFACRAVLTLCTVFPFFAGFTLFALRTAEAFEPFLLRPCKTVFHGDVVGGLSRFAVAGGKRHAHCCRQTQDGKRFYDLVHVTVPPFGTQDNIIISPACLSRAKWKFIRYLVNAALRRTDAEGGSKSA